MPANDKPVSNAEIFWQELQHLQRQITDMGSQVQRIRRNANVDVNEAVIREHDNRSEMILAVRDLTDVVSVLVQRRTEELHPDMAGQQLHSWARQQRSRDVAKKLAYYRYMSTLKKEIVEKCPCGKHQGIRFVTEDGKVVEENYCPQWWWLAMSRMAFSSGKAAEFRERMPLEKWLERYAIKSPEKA